MQQTPATLTPSHQYPPLPPLVPPPSTIGPGRPRFFDKARCQEVCTLVAAGCGIDGAARHVGCVPRTIRREARRNPLFGADLRHALQTAELDPLNAVREAATHHWRAAAWLLERTNPKQFARQHPEAIPIEEFHMFIDKLKSEIVWHVQVRNQYLPLLGKLRRLAEKVQNIAQIRNELPAFKPGRPLEEISRPAATPNPTNSQTI